MDDLFINALETGSVVNLSSDDMVEFFPALLAEYRRLHAWTASCLGTEVSNFGGLEVDHA